MSEYLKVDGHPDLVRDPKSGAIININSGDIERARLSKQSKKRQEQELQDLKHEVSEIKILLRQLLEKS
jgi:hypothetical protein